MARMWFTVLGPVRAWRDGAEIDLGAPQQRAVLAVLLVRAGEPVSLAEIVDTLWWENPPATAVNAVHRSIGLLRRALEPQLGPRDVGRWLVRAGGGYRLDGDVDTVDLLRFRHLKGLFSYEEALELWQGPAGSTLPADVRARPVFAALDREYEAAAAEAADAALAAGDAGRLLRVIEVAADRAPLNEPLHARLMLMLDATGQPAQAVRRFEELRKRLDDELGIPPGPEVTAARNRLAAPVSQLPRALPGFTGREAELAAGLELLGDQVVGTISGMAGVGKTTFAVHLAHRVAGRCPDGQLYLNLRGFGAGPAMDPAEALARLLGDLGVPHHRVPAGLDARAALYRTRLAGRRMLVLLDNARDTAQVRPLLPGAPGCLVLVTSRDWLAGLIVSDGARPIALGAFSTGESRELLAARLGRARIDAEPAAADKLIGLCGGLPLALAIVAARAAMQPGRPLETLTDLGPLGDPATDLRAVFSWSYRVLPEAPARLFRLLGLHPGADISAPAAASLAGIGVAAVRPLLAELVRAGLLTEVAPGRYGAHDLLRAYAADLADPAAGDRDRLLAHYLHTAHRAALLLAPGRDPITLDPPPPGAMPESLASPEQALAWLTAEYRVLRAFVEAAPDRAAWQLAWTLDTFQRRQGHRHDHVATRQTALAAAKRLGDPLLIADAYRDLGHALSSAGRPDEARAHLTYALDRYAELGDTVRQAHVERGIGHSYVPATRYDMALRHLRRAEQLYRAAGHRAGLAKCLNETGYMHVQLGEFEDARAPGEQALAMFRELGDQHGQAATLDTLGAAHAGLGDHDRAIPCFRESAELCRAVGDRRSEAEVLINLGDVLDPAAAVAAWQAALDILEDLGIPDTAKVRERIFRVAPTISPQGAL